MQRTGHSLISTNSSPHLWKARGPLRPWGRTGLGTGLYPQATESHCTHDLDSQACSPSDNLSDRVSPHLSVPHGVAGGQASGERQKAQQDFLSPRRARGNRGYWACAVAVPAEPPPRVPQRTKKVGTWPLLKGQKSLEALVSAGEIGTAGRAWQPIGLMTHLRRPSRCATEPGDRASTKIPETLCRPGTLHRPTPKPTPASADRHESTVGPNMSLGRGGSSRGQKLRLVCVWVGEYVAGTFVVVWGYL